MTVRIARQQLTTRGVENVQQRRDTILILDFGGQYCHLIARAVRELYITKESVPIQDIAKVVTR